MISNESLKQLSAVHNCIEKKLSDQVLVYLETINAQEISEELLNDDVLQKNDALLTYDEALRYFIELCSYVEEETTLPSLITDETYDMLVEKFIDLGEEQPIGSPTSNIVGIGDKPHKFPELRGSLTKVHFIYNNEIPEKDTRKSLEGYLNKVVKKCKDAGISLSNIPISVDFKYDGVSHVLEGTMGNIDTILTRGDTDNNMGKDLTPVFKKLFPTDENDELNEDNLVASMRLNLIPCDMWYENSQYGIKVETYMRTDKFDEFKKEINDEKCNRRSAVTSICNQDAKNIDRDNDLKKYLSMQHFQIASTKKIEMDKETTEPDHWKYIGKINNRYQYLYVDNVYEVNLEDIQAVCELVKKSINYLQKLADIQNIPIDGIVISILDEKVIDLLGRKNNKNMFQVAFKFPAGVEKTTIEKVDFQVGPIAGVITPMARLKPIKINGNTISNVTLSNKDKLERLQIREGDEVIIKYDIVPTIFKDKTCKSSNKPLVEFPTECPICSAPIENERCSNRNCPAKIVGRIFNFVDKNKIGGGIGFNTIIDFVNHDYLKSIGDLFRLYRNRKELCNIQGYGESSIDSILGGISDAREMYPHQVFGGIGIPNIGMRIMEKVCKEIDLIGNLYKLDDIVDSLNKIKGIGEKTTIALIDGIKENMSVIEDLLNNVTIKPYKNDEVITDVVCFSSTRDKDFERYLEDNHVKVSESLTKEVTILIIPDEPVEKKTGKMKKAEENGIDIISISEAKKRWKYER